jgi:hypothetical protein
MKKIIMYIAIFIGVFFFFLLFAIFAMGDTNILEWDATIRSAVGIMTTVISVFSIAINEDINGKKQ